MIASKGIRMMKSKNFRRILATGLGATLCAGLVHAADKQDLVDRTGGKSADRALKLKSSGVPSYDFPSLRKTKNGLPPRIPVLNVGEEPRVSYNPSFEVAVPAAAAFQLPAPGRPPRLEKIATPRTKPLASPASAAKIEKSLGQPGALPSIERETAQMDGVAPKAVAETEAQPVRSLSPAEIDLVKSLIYLDIRRDSLMSLSLLSSLKDAGSEPKEMISYHYARAAWYAGLPVESRNTMQGLLKTKNAVVRNETVKFMIQTAAKGEADLVEAIETARGTFEVEESHQYLINTAKYWDRKGDLSKSLAALEEIPADAKVAAEAAFLKGLISYRSGEVTKAQKELATVLEVIENGKENITLRSAAALTLARLHFQLGDYKKAFDTYLKVHKSYSEWPQAMMEQAWAQILSKDYEGAAGNMFTLHTDFFKNTFAPESYVVRTVGYLNLCQFGDGMKAMTDLKNRYAQMSEFMLSRKSERPGDLALYNEVKTLFQNPGKKDWLLPKPIVIELARSQYFVKAQQRINAVEDENTKFGQVIMDILGRERQLNQSIAALTEQIHKYGEKPPPDPATLKTAEADLDRQKWELGLVKKSRKALRAMQSKAQESYAKLKDGYKGDADRAVHGRYEEIKKNLAHVLDQSEILRYELFAGASHHLRKEAGATAEPESSAAAAAGVPGKAGAKKAAADRVRWEFKGEIWEDELGHFRSSLQNVCTENGEAKATVSANDN